MLSLKNLELLIVIKARFRGAVPAVAGGPAFALTCCMGMPADRGSSYGVFALFTGSAGDRKRGESFKSFEPSY